MRCARCAWTIDPIPRPRSLQKRSSSWRNEVSAIRSGCASVQFDLYRNRLRLQSARNTAPPGSVALAAPSSLSPRQTGPEPRRARRPHCGGVFLWRRLSLGFADIPRTGGRLQKHACHVAAGWALIPDQAGLTCERLNPHHLVHYGFASRTCKAAALRLQNVCQIPKALAMAASASVPQKRGSQRQLFDSRSVPTTHVIARAVAAATRQRAVASSCRRGCR
jgi:hypothetical protein